MKTDQEPPGRGKIARLPLALREQVNTRLLNGQNARHILPWLNALPEVQALLEAEFGGESVNDQNLSAWRRGGYQQWLQRQERVERTRDLARVAAQHSRADGGNIAAGAASIVAGKLLAIMEDIDEAADGEKKVSPDTLVKFAAAIAAMRSGDQYDIKLAHEQRKLTQKDEELRLAREKFQRDTAETVLKYLADDRARSIEAGAGTNAEKIEIMGRHIFGDLWKPK
jgi:hypothetical protein